MTPVAIDPRIRERRIVVARHQGRRRLRILLIGICLIAVIAGLWFAAHSPLLSVHSYSLTGAVHETRPEVLAAGDLRSGNQPMINVNPGRSQQGIESLPWVQKASVVRHWPWRVAIKVTERVPVGVVPQSNGPAQLVDAMGRLLGSTPPGSPSPGLPTIDGVSSVGKPGSYIASKYAGELGVARAIPSNLLAGVTQVAELPTGQYSVYWGPTIEVLMGTPTNLPAKFEALATLVSKIDTTGITQIDLSVPDLPTVSRGNPGPGPAPTGSPPK